MKFITKYLRTTEFSLSLLFVLGFISLALTSGGVLLSGQSIRSFLAYLAIPILIGLAQMVVLAVGQLNLAVGAMGGATAAVMAQMMIVWETPIWVAMLSGLFVATLMGAVNGFLVVSTGLNGFIITLGTLTILEIGRAHV